MLSDKAIRALHEQLRDALGERICNALGHPRVTEIKVGGDGVLFIKKQGEGWIETAEHLSCTARVSALNIMASLLDKKLTTETADLSGELPLTGDRVQGKVPPECDAPMFVIRRHAPEVFSLASYLEEGILEPWQADTLVEHVQKRSNIIIAGATNSGKTTLVNTLLSWIDTNEHVVVVEDTKELKVPCKNVTRLFTGKPRPTLHEQVLACLRLAPDRMVIGETRNEAGIAILEAWDTGHRGGITTVHAESAERVFDRFARFYELAKIPPQWRLMQAAIDLIGFMQIDPITQRRRMTELAVVPKEKQQKPPVPLVRLGPSHAETITLN